MRLQLDSTAKASLSHEHLYWLSEQQQLDYFSNYQSDSRVLQANLESVLYSLLHLLTDDLCATTYLMYACVQVCFQSRNRVSLFVS